MRGYDGQNSSWFCNCPDTRLICATSSVPSKDGWPGPLNMHFNNNLLPIDIALTRFCLMGRRTSHMATVAPPYFVSQIFHAINHAYYWQIAWPTKLPYNDKVRFLSRVCGEYVFRTVSFQITRLHTSGRIY
ncbi:hypothetical protein CEXT_737281 [Caerostris extrusa]|uniref:Uncharacterized protein n=1 Tax=Caerostris extrusa TaxID=172846 RepID=A0AAV4WRZ7_CAEEX|nr:hypothetical protein CEXT_737281 [Caerostris extrusa]